MHFFHKIKLLIILIFLFCYTNRVNALPQGFVYLNDVDPTITQEIKYYSADNFIGRRIKGYDAPTCILTYKTALALSHVQKQLRHKGMGLKIYDCYRPSMAVEDFISWSSNPYDQKQKVKYYPYVNKADFFKLGYVAKKSGHSRGSTVDLTLVGYNMGTHFDYMDERSHPCNKKLSTSVQHNRLYLRMIMINAGFKPLETEWWHFTLKNETYSHTYFNFPVS